MSWTLFLPGGILALMGAFMLAMPPRHPTWWRGYRSPRSMRSQQAWEESNRLAGQLLVLAGFLAMNTALTCWFFTQQPGRAMCIVLLASACLVAAAVVITELDLARNFDREGRRR